MQAPMQHAAPGYRKLHACWSSMQRCKAALTCTHIKAPPLAWPQFELQPGGCCRATARVAKVAARGAAPYAWAHGVRAAALSSHAPLRTRVPGAGAATTAASHEPWKGTHGAGAAFVCVGHITAGLRQPSPRPRLRVHSVRRSSPGGSSSSRSSGSGSTSRNAGSGKGGSDTRKTASTSGTDSNSSSSSSPGPKGFGHIRLPDAVDGEDDSGLGFSRRGSSSSSSSSSSRGSSSSPGPKGFGHIRLPDAVDGGDDGGSNCARSGSSSGSSSNKDSSKSGSSLKGFGHIRLPDAVDGGDDGGSGFAGDGKPQRSASGGGIGSSNTSGGSSTLGISSRDTGRAVGSGSNRSGDSSSGSGSRGSSAGWPGGGGSSSRSRSGRSSGRSGGGGSREQGPRSKNAPVRLFLYAADEVQTECAIEGAGLWGVVGVTRQVARAHAVLGVKCDAQGKHVRLQQGERTAHNAGVPFLCAGRRMTAASLAVALLPVMRYPLGGVLPPARAAAAEAALAAVAAPLLAARAASSGKGGGSSSEVAL